MTIHKSIIGVVDGLERIVMKVIKGLYKISSDLSFWAGFVTILLGRIVFIKAFYYCISCTHIIGEFAIRFLNLMFMP